MTFKQAEWKLILLLPLTVVSLLIVTFFYGPIKYTFHPSALLLMALFYFAYFFGYLFYRLIAKKIKSRKVFSSIEIDITTNIIGVSRTLTFLTFLFISFSIYDFFLVGDVLNVGITETRELRTLDGPRESLIGFLIVLLMGAPILLFVALMMIDSRVLKGVNPIFYKTQVLFSWVGLLSYFLSGGRNQFAISMVIILLVMVTLRKIQNVTKKVNIFRTMFILIVLCSIFLFMLFIFIDRANYQGITMQYYVERMENDFPIEVRGSNFFEGIVSEYYYSFIVFLFYLNHPIMMISEYFDVSFMDFTYGALTFQLPAMFCDTLFGTTFFSTALDALILKGVYLSMPGYLYIDFGFSGVILVSLLLGFFIPYFFKKLSISRYKGETSFNYMIFFTLLLATVVLAPIYNILSSFGFSILLTLTIVNIYILSKNYFRKIHLRKSL